MNLLKRSKAKQPKKSAIENYTASYLDKKSKGYHKIIMTGFVGMFGVVGGLYIFGSNAASPSGSTDSTTNTSLIPYFVIAFVAVVIAIGAYLIFNVMRKNK